MPTPSSLEHFQPRDIFVDVRVPCTPRLFSSSSLNGRTAGKGWRLGSPPAPHQPLTHARAGAVYPAPTRAIDCPIICNLRDVLPSLSDDTIAALNRRNQPRMNRGSRVARVAGERWLLPARLRFDSCWERVLGRFSSLVEPISDAVQQWYCGVPTTAGFPGRSRLAEAQVLV